METRPFGRTGHESSVLVFGAIALDALSQAEANEMMADVLSRGVNHVDVAPTYGDAEEKLAPTLADRREDLFLGCKTQERTREGSRAELEASLDRMGVDSVDLYQFHAVTNEEEIDAITGPGGALEAVREAREAGLVDHIGLTSHGEPSVIIEAIDRIDDLETVMFPLNFVVLGRGDPDHDYTRVLEQANKEDLGTIGIKAFAKAPWPPEDELPREERPYETWYEPFDDEAAIRDCLNYALSHDLTGITNAGDPRLVPAILDAAENVRALSATEQASLEANGRDMETPVPAPDL